MMKLSQPETSEKKKVQSQMMDKDRGLVKPGFFGQSSLVRKNGRKMPPIGSHQWLDLIDLAMHRATARKIRRRPKLFDRVRRTLAHWQRVKRACPAPLREWREIL